MGKIIDDLEIYELTSNYCSFEKQTANLKGYIFTYGK
jgi:hypothetical protein